MAQRAADARAAKSMDGQRERIEAELAGVRPSATVKAEIDGLMLDPRRRRLQVN